jgi:hypothetical protein
LGVVLSGFRLYAVVTHATRTPITHRHFLHNIARSSREMSDREAVSDAPSGGMDGAETGVMLGFAERLIEGKSDRSEGQRKDDEKQEAEAGVVEPDGGEERSGEITHFLWHEVLPSQVGGRPLWLQPRTPPSLDLVACPHCSLPMPLLVQVSVSVLVVVFLPVCVLILPCGRPGELMRSFESL